MLFLILKNFDSYFGRIFSEWQEFISLLSFYLNKVDKVLDKVLE